MPTCAKCESVFPVTVVIKGRKRNLQRRKYCLDCSPFGGRNTRTLLENATNTRTCSKCRVEQCVSHFYRYSSGQNHSWCKTCLKGGVVAKQRQLKIEAILYKGGVCEKCGCMPHPVAMSFHHRDPTQKDFTISRAKTKTLDAVKKELDKCALLCRNCHGIVHAGDGWEILWEAAVEKWDARDSNPGPSA